jgi:hypothetical protein
VREKLTLTAFEPRENVARYFMVALRDDSNLPVRRVLEPSLSGCGKRPPQRFYQSQSRRMTNVWL